MTVYVDDMRAPYGRMIMCHMIADSDAELVAMARRIGVARRWHQYPGTPRSHFDICLAKRRRALDCGAMAVSARTLAGMIRQRRREAA